MTDRVRFSKWIVGIDTRESSLPPTESWIEIPGMWPTNNEIIDSGKYPGGTGRICIAASKSQNYRYSFRISILYQHTLRRNLLNIQCRVNDNKRKI